MATPIGNPDDISARAIRTLAEVNLIACEDTRRTGQMLARHQIDTPTVSHFEHNEERRVPELIERLKAGDKIALVTDAGTPAISDPGFRLVRAALEANVRVIAVPGASAVIAAIVDCRNPDRQVHLRGIYTDARRGARLRRWKNFVASRARWSSTRPRAGSRIRSAAMATAFGESRDAAVVCEITKTYERTIRGTLGELERRFRATPALGEIVIVVAGAAGESNAEDVDAGSSRLI